MRATRQLRNKLLHIDLIKVGTKLGQLGHAAGEPIVRKVKLDPRGDLVAQIRDAAENAPYLAPDADPIEGNIFGWFLQCGRDLRARHPVLPHRERDPRPAELGAVVAGVSGPAPPPSARSSSPGAAAAPSPAPRG